VAPRNIVSTTRKKNRTPFNQVIKIAPSAAGERRAKNGRFPPLSPACGFAYMEGPDGHGE
jgi:hypothetical protein